MMNLGSRAATLLRCVLVTLALVSCSDGGGGGSNPIFPSGSVVIAPTTVTLAPGQTTTLAASVRDGQGNEVTGQTVTWTSSANTVATVTNAGLVTGVAAGNATITATAGRRTGTVAVTVSAADPCTAVQAVTVGQTISATLSASDCRLASDSTAIKRYSFTLTAPTRVELQMTSTAFDAYLFLQDSTQTVIGEDDDGGTGTNARLLRLLPAGRYIITANSFNANQFGAFQLSVTAAPTACTTARVITLPSTTAGSLSTASCPLVDKSYEDRYEVNLTTRTTIAVGMTSTAIDPLLLVVNAADSVLANDDDSGAGLNAALEVLLEPGKYFILARGYPNQTGAYSLDVRTRVDPCAVTNTITSAAPVNSSLTTSSCAISDGGGPNRYFQRYLLNVSAATPARITLTSTAFDAYLVLQNATTGALIAENDDESAATTNSLLAVNLPAGQYIVNATSYETGEVGAFTLTVTGVTASTVALTVTPATVTLASGLTQQSTATVTGTTNTAVRWSSGAPGVASVSDAGLIRAITPGTAVITATSLADPSKTGTTTVTVPGAAGSTNLDIAAAYFVQSVQQLDRRVPLIADRAAVARVFLRGNRTGIGTATVRVRIFNGATLIGTYTGSTTPTLTVDESCCSADIAIPATAIRAGYSFLVDADPANAITETNETDNSLPLSGTAEPLSIVAAPTFNVRLVPVQQNRVGTPGTASATLANIFRSVMPVNVVNVTTRATLVIDYAVTTGPIDSWARLVRDLEIVRRTDNVDAFYYGLLRSSATSGVLGLANGIPARTAIGLDEGSGLGAASARLTFVHEMGHTLSLRHAPCGGAAGPDPVFPFTNGATGVYGMDTFNGNAIKSPTFNDLMGYCSPNEWISAYHYRKVMDFRTANPSGVARASSVVMISGSANARGVQLDPAFAADAHATPDDPAGRFVVEGFTEDGGAVFSRRFTPYQVSDAAADAEAFVLAVPLTAAQQAMLARITVRELSGGRRDERINTTLLARAASARAFSNDVAASVSMNASGPSIRWSPNDHPVVIVRDRVSGDIRGMGRNGELDLAQFGGADAVDLEFSNGVTSVRRRVDSRTGTIR
jgi:uncharacterized protein YjdB